MIWVQYLFQVLDEVLDLALSAGRAGHDGVLKLWQLRRLGLRLCLCVCAYVYLRDSVLNFAERSPQRVTNRVNISRWEPPEGCLRASSSVCQALAVWADDAGEEVR